MHLNILGQPALERRELTLHRLGTLVKLVCYVPDTVDVEILWAEVTLEIDRFNKVISDYDSLSELSRVNATAFKDTILISKELNECLALSAQVWKASGGHYDPALGRLTHLWRVARRTNLWPTHRTIQDARKQSGWLNVYYDSLQRHIFMRQPVLLDLGGMGKGYIGDKLGAHLKAKGVEAFFIDLGGDIILGAPPPGTAGWAIGTPLPELGTITLQHTAVMGSGSTYQYIQHKKRRHSHLVKPIRGLGVTHNRTSVIITADGGRADAWATAINIMSKKSLKKQNPELLWTVISSRKCIMSKYFYEYLQKHSPPWKPPQKLVII